MTPSLSKDKISLNVALEVVDLVSTKPACRIGLPTGKTPEVMYQHLIELSKEKLVDWSGAKFFGLDEYLNTANAKTFKFYLEKHFYQPLSINKKACFNPLETDDYDGLIEREGGLDLTILGIGQNGHIAFNEPPTSKETWTHCIQLADSTREANKAYFQNSESVPENAVTMGIETLLASKRVILMAFGDKKQSILKNALMGDITQYNPASYLQLHSNLSVYTDFEYN